MSVPPRELSPQQLEAIRLDVNTFWRYYQAATVPTPGQTCARCNAPASRLTTQPPAICGRCLFALWKPRHDTLIIDIFPERSSILVDGNAGARTRAQLKQLMATAATNAFLAEAAQACRDWKDEYDAEPRQVDLAGVLVISEPTLHRRLATAGFTYKPFLRWALSDSEKTPKIDGF